ncbi:CTP synthase [Candidatus Woesearchaeota archaeon]|nr:CTP synthase [Candidatus Woesearchaeota archaeon]
MEKYIFIIGGVISGVGKGVATASIAKILKEYGLNISVIKIDPYINCDAGTLRPTEHGEVWVTEDGGEIDQDLGTYERFLEKPLSKSNSITTGQIYKTLIEKERKGDFLGETVQYIPHVPEEIKLRIREIGKNHDIVLIEIGGTVGDYENIPFLFAAKSLENDIGKENVSYILVSYMPIPSHIDEMKTKPTQLAIKLLRENGIQPDFILCRGKKALDNVRKKKLEKYSNINAEYIISVPDVSSIYIIPLQLEKENLGEKLLKTLNLKKKKEPNWQPWINAISKSQNPSKEINIALVGKYLDIGEFQLKDSYLSVNEAINNSASFNNIKVKINWLDSKNIEKGLVDFKGCNGIIIPGGFGNSGVEGKIQAIKYARENNIPFLGLCFGLQLAVVEFSRNVCKLNAHSTEIDPEVEHNVIDILDEQRNIKEKGATMRLGSYKAILKDNTKIKEIYNSNEVYERHRHRYEVNPKYHSILEKNGLILSGLSPNGKLVEFIELENHPFFIATQAHPEFKSSLLNPSPLFNAFIKACLFNQEIEKELIKEL